jgi:AcrR family transcriptional regulator
VKFDLSFEAHFVRSNTMKSLNALVDASALPPRRQMRSERTRRAIENAAIGLFARAPVDAVTIDDIVSAAEVAKGTFYLHFSDKRALIEALAVSIRGEVEPIVAQANEGIIDPAMRLARGIGVYVRFALDHPDRALLLGRIDDSQLSASAALNQGVVSDLAYGLSTGRLSFDTIDAAIIFVAGTARVVVLAATRATDDASAQAMAQQMVAMVLRGLGLTGSEPDDIAASAIAAIVCPHPA